MSSFAFAPAIALGCAISLGACDPLDRDLDCAPAHGIWEGPDAWGAQIGISRENRVVRWYSTRSKLANVAADLASVEPRAMPLAGLVAQMPTPVDSILVSSEVGHLVLAQDEGYHRIVVLALGPDGTPQDKWVTIRAWDPDVNPQYVWPHAAWIGDAWVVSWMEQRPYDMRAMRLVRVRADGSLMDAEPFELGLSSRFGSSELLLATLGDVLWAVWSEEDPSSSIGSLQVVGKRIDPATWTVLDDEPIVLMPESGNPVLAVNDEQALVLAFAHVDGGGFASRPIDAAGAVGQPVHVVGPPERTIRGFVPVSDGYRLVLGDEYNNDFPRFDGVTTIHALLPDGSLRGDVAQIDALNAAVASDGDTLFLADVVTETDGTDGISRVRVRSIGADGAVLTEGTVEENEMQMVDCSSVIGW